jgi:hypothetical protein
MMLSSVVLQYLRPEVGNVKVDQKNLHAYWVRDGYWKK